MMHRRIRLARQHAGMTQQQVGDALGVSKASVAQWESVDDRQRTKPAIANLVRFGEITGAPLWWLLSTDDLRESDLLSIPTESDYGALPLATSCPEITGTEPCRSITPPPVISGALAVTCPDGAMSPDVAPGDILICRPGRIGQDALCVATLGDLVLVRRYRDTGASRVLVAASPDYPPLEAEKTETILPVLELRRLTA